MKILDLFAGIGVASLAADMVWGDVEHEFVEINPYSQTILHKHWPRAKIHGDITTYHYDGEPVDLVWGSPPCQAASSAGKRKGTEDKRWLWPDTFRVIREARPKYWILENVRGLLS
ncbi:MAG: DNA cytosine methyltransferase, partial [Parcubacteria group bacterium]